MMVPMSLYQPIDDLCQIKICIGQNIRISILKKQFMQDLSISEDPSFQKCIPIFGHNVFRQKVYPFPDLQ